MFEDIGKLTPYNTFNDRLLFQTMKMQKCTKAYTNKCPGDKGRFKVSVKKSLKECRKSYTQKNEFKSESVQSVTKQTG